MDRDYIERAEEAAAFLRSRLPGPPEAAAVLGSGLSGVADAVRDAVHLPYADVPGFPLSGVPGHQGALATGTIAGLPVLLLCGRVHLYEGLTPAEVAFPVRVLAALGVGRLVLTNAAGGIAPALEPGSLMLLSDHIDLTGANPLRGPNLERFGPRFPDMTQAYDPALRRLALEAAAGLGLGLAEGVYAAMPGPSYETPAEVRMLGRLGADAVGMSTVPETVAARHAGLRVLAFSVIANRAAGLGEQALGHAEVLRACRRGGRRLAALLEEVFGRIARGGDRP